MNSRGLAAQNREAYPETEAGIEAQISVNAYLAREGQSTLGDICKALHRLEYDMGPVLDYMAGKGYLRVLEVQIGRKTSIQYEVRRTGTRR